MRQADVAIIGGGIIGCAAAFYLSKQGKRVILLEKGRIAGEQSSRNWGAVRAQRRQDSELALMLEGISLWEGLETELQANLDWRQQGIMRIIYDEKWQAWAEDWLPTARAAGLDTRVVKPKELHDLLPGFDSKSALGALYTSTDGCAEPEKVAPAFANAARKLGADIRANCAALDIVSQAGRVSGVETEQDFVQVDTVIVASGAWTSRVLKPLGHLHPSLWIRGTAARTQKLSFDLRKQVSWGLSAHRQRPDGSLTLAANEDGYHDLMLDSLRYGLRFSKLGWQNRSLLRFSLGSPFYKDLNGEFSNFVTHRTLEPHPDLKGLEKAKTAFAREYPKAPALKIERAWAGWIDYMPDELPVIGEIDELPGTIVAAGFHGNGFGMGPIVGKILADIVAKGASNHDLSAFSPSRFKPLFG